MNDKHWINPRYCIALSNVTCNDGTKKKKQDTEIIPSLLEIDVPCRLPLPRGSPVRGLLWETIEGGIERENNTERK